MPNTLVTSHRLAHTHTASALDAFSAHSIPDRERVHPNLLRTTASHPGGGPPAKAPADAHRTVELKCPRPSAHHARGANRPRQPCLPKPAVRVGHRRPDPSPRLLHPRGPSLKFLQTLRKEGLVQPHHSPPPFLVVDLVERVGDVCHVFSLIQTVTTP